MVNVRNANGTQGQNRRALIDLLPVSSETHSGRTALLGRPPTTSHALIEKAAFALFAARGFDDVTVDDIAEAAGIGRRTLFRYYPSKNDIPWGQFDESLRNLAATLDATPRHLLIAEAVHRAVKDFNLLDEGAVDQHRERMRLLMETPALLAHSALRHTAWRQVIASFVAGRLGLPQDALFPRTVGRIALALALSAYEQWLQEPESDLSSLIDQAYGSLAEYLRAA